MCGDGRLVDMKAYVNGRLGGIEAGACGAGLRRRPAGACGAYRRLRRLPAPVRAAISDEIICTGHNITE